MHKQLDVSAYRFDGSKKFVIADQPNEVERHYESKKQYRKLLEEFQKEIDVYQNMMYAQDRYGMLLIFQAMDAAGKDGTIRHIMYGVNPHGVDVHAFKAPTAHELDHDFMWRTTRKVPKRGNIGIFNRSYYEEVLVVKVHPEILTKYQRIPSKHTEPLKTVWENRYEDIRNLEEYLHRNGIPVVKFFLNLSKDEQARRFLDRIERQEKNWKFSSGDVKERAYWDDYQQAYQDAINETARPHAPWYVIPADDKKNMRLMVSQAILNEMSKLKLKYPELPKDQVDKLGEYAKQLRKELGK